MEIINGSIVPGMVAASRTLKAQLPKLIQQFPEIGTCYPGTINLQLDHNLLIINPDFVSKPISWKTEIDPGGVETFGFLRCLLLANEIEHESWIYIPYGSSHRRNLNIHEIISSKIPKLAYGGKVAIGFARQFIRLPYHLNQAYII